METRLENVFSTTEGSRSRVAACQAWSRLASEDVTEQYKEPHIQTLYRKPGSSAAQCLGSLFQGTNETVNFWTHFVALLGLVSYFRYSCPDCIEDGGIFNPYCYPLYMTMVSISLYHTMSCIAHIFCSMSPRIRHICFFLDYGAISVFSIGAAVSAGFYMFPEPTGIPVVDSKLFFLTTNSFVSVLATILCCATRHRWKEAKYIIRTVAFMLPFFAGNLHVMYRAVSCCFLVSNECHPSLISAANCWLFYFFAALFNGSRIPERWYPKKFDFIGQSHHWFHVLTSLGTLELYRANLIEANYRWIPSSQAQHMTVAVWWIGGTLLVVSIAVVFFAVQIGQDGHLKSKKTD